MNVRTMIVSMPPVRKTCLALAYRLGAECAVLHRIPRRRVLKTRIQTAKVDVLLFLVRLLAKKDGSR